MLQLPIHSSVTFVLVTPHYPENVGAAARAIKTMGFTHLALVKPGRLAVPEHEMAHRMAVKSWDVLQSAAVYSSVQEATEGASLVAATTARRGVSGIMSARQFAELACTRSSQRVVVLFGNEKTGLGSDIVDKLDVRIRIPMAADQPSINLAQAVQLVAYELFVAALEHRANLANELACHPT